MFLPGLSQCNLSRFFQHRFNQLRRLLSAVETFAKRYVMIYCISNFCTFSKQLLSLQGEGSLDSSSLKAFQNKSQVGCFCMLCSCNDYDAARRR